MKTLNILFTITILSLFAFSCNKDEPIEPTPKNKDIYICGFEYNADSDTRTDVAKVWKNGTATNLSDGIHDAYARSVVVSGTDVYVAGTESNGTKFVAKYWKNGTATNIVADNTILQSRASSIFVK